MRRLWRLLLRALAPALGVYTALHPRSRGTWRRRWALELPPLPPGAVWVHASSVGEGRAASALLDALRGAGREEPLLRTAMTAEGLAAAQGQDLAWPLPVDLPAVVARFLNHTRPGVLVLIEAELWPELICACADRQIPVLVAGARVGPGLRRLHRVAPRWLGALGVRWLPRSVEDAEALRALGLRPEPVLGELKLDAQPPPAALRLPRPLLVAASTRAGDEARVLDALAGQAGVTRLLAPRQLERVPEVEALLRARGLRWARRTALQGEVEPGSVLLLDTLGELASLLPQADAVFVGGTFDPALGGHSPAEALAQGLPVVAGPCTHGHAALFAQPGVEVVPEPGALGPALQRALGRGRRPTAGGAAARLAAEVWAAHNPAVPEGPLRPGLQRLAPVVQALGRRRSAPARAPVPVISVGALTAGGVGKTPVVAWVCAALEGLGARPAVVARGYGRGPGPALRGPEGQTGAAWLGDELELLRRRGLRVVSCPDRLVGARAAAAQGADVVVLDDGFQRRDLHRVLDLVVVDAERPLAGGLLPGGDAREGPEALARADVLWVQGARSLPAGFARALRAEALQLRGQVQPTGWLRGGQALPLDALRGPVLAFAGVAWPGRVLRTLRQLGLEPVDLVAFPDHHPFRSEELDALARRAGGLPLVTTEKDLARLSEGWPGWALRVEAQPEHPEALRARLAAALQ